LPDKNNGILSPSDKKSPVAIAPNDHNEGQQPESVFLSLKITMKDVKEASKPKKRKKLRPNHETG
jgi:hypothetical protein